MTIRQRRKQADRLERRADWLQKIADGLRERAFELRKWRPRSLFVAIFVVAWGIAPLGAARAADGHAGGHSCDFCRCAAKALRGDYGRLPEWKRVAYYRGLHVGHSRRRAWATTYFPSEGHHRGDETRWGYPCSERVASANRLKPFSFVWVAGHLRQVLDTGGASNDRMAERLGADLWIDFWEPQEGRLFGDENGGVRVVYVISGRPR